LSLITLYYSDVQGRSLPINYRVYDKAEGKTKNDYFLEMLDEVLAWGLRPSYVTGDTWYSGTENLKSVKNHGQGLMFAVESRRTVFAMFLVQCFLKIKRQQFLENLTG